jgi:quercetin dioxygenase-like cupin family protein
MKQKQGDLWYFPAGVGHTLQATNASEDGAEFLLVFPDGTFSDATST